jgi:hypothetical protein
MRSMLATATAQRTSSGSSESDHATSRHFVAPVSRAHVERGTICDGRRGLNLHGVLILLSSRTYPGTVRIRRGSDLGAGLNVRQDCELDPVAVWRSTCFSPDVKGLNIPYAADSFRLRGDMRAAAGARTSRIRSSRRCALPSANGARFYPHFYWRGVRPSATRGARPRRVNQADGRYWARTPDPPNRRRIPCTDAPRHRVPYAGESPVSGQTLSDIGRHALTGELA